MLFYVQFWKKFKEKNLQIIGFYYENTFDANKKMLWKIFTKKYFLLLIYNI